MSYSGKYSLTMCMGQKTQMNTTLVQTESYDMGMLQSSLILIFE